MTPICAPVLKESISNPPHVFCTTSHPSLTDITGQLEKSLRESLVTILQDIAPLWVPSGCEQPLVDFVVSVLRESGFEVTLDKVSNIEARRGPIDEKLVAINCHTDTVQTERDRNIENCGVIYDRGTDEIHANGTFMAGFDDKAGISIALTLAKHTDLPMKIVLTTGEEIGGLGIRALRREAWDDVSFCLTLDRKHGTDLISFYCGRRCAPLCFVKKFIEIAEKEVGITYTDTCGSIADTYWISKFVPCVNLSTGYYNPHTNQDYVKVNEMYNSMMAVKAAIENRSKLETAIASASKMETEGEKHV